MGPSNLCSVMCMAELPEHHLSDAIHFVAMCALESCCGNLLRCRPRSSITAHPDAKGVRQKESGKKVTKKVTKASEKVTEK